MNRIRKAMLGGGLAIATVTGGAVCASLIGTAHAADSTSTTTPAHSQPNPPAQTPNFDPTKDGHVANGITETVLTGDTPDKATATALAAVPGATAQRVSTDAEVAV